MWQIVAAETYVVQFRREGHQPSPWLVNSGLPVLLLAAALFLLMSRAWPSLCLPRVTRVVVWVFVGWFIVSAATVWTNVDLPERGSGAAFVVGYVGLAVIAEELVFRGVLFQLALDISGRRVGPVSGLFGNERGAAR